MPINQAIWEISDGIPTKVHEADLDKEKELENILVRDLAILNNEWMLVGRQVLTSYNNYIDILAIDRNGYLIIIELKRDKTPRDVVGQAIDYASWVKDLKAENIYEIYKKYNGNNNGISLETSFKKKFNIELTEDSINQGHQIVIVASSIDSSTERIVKYLSDSEIPINVILFSIFETENSKYLSRVWMIEPVETEENAMTRGSKNPWNGEYYCSFGDDNERSWKDALKYGFISGGGGRWYTKTLGYLNPGDRVWVNIPGTGFVGVGIVKQSVMKMSDTIFNHEGHSASIYEIEKNATYGLDDTTDDNAEYCVLVEWVKSVEKNMAVKELGFFGNQNTVCRPTTPKWGITVDRLKEKWKVK